MAHELDDHWFAAKREGFGSAMPTAWQGWAVTALYALVMTGAALVLTERSLIGFLAIALAATASFLMVCAHKTEGGWQWHAAGTGDRDGRRRLLLALAAAALVAGGLLLTLID